MDKSIIVIGAGIAGLSTGCYGQMNGYQTRLFEMHDLPGGLCTSWKRKGFVFDGCIHWLVGSASGSFRQIWDELGALQGKEIVDHEEFVRIVHPDGKAFIVYTDIDRLEAHMLELSPQDAPLIKEFTHAIRQFSDFDEPLDMPKTSFQRLALLLKMLPKLPALNKWSKTTMQDFAARFIDPFLREVFPMVFEIDDFPVIGAIVTLAGMNEKNSGYPLGGSLLFSQAIEERYKRLGGEIYYNSSVEKILVDNQRAVGIQLADGSQYFADIIISAADGHATIFDMLEGRFINDEIRGYYDNLPIFNPYVQVSMGVKRDMSDQPHAVQYLLEKPLKIAERERKAIGVRHLCFDPTLAPKGNSVVEVLFELDYQYWKKLAEDSEHYEAEKQQIAIQTMNYLETLYPGFTAQVEVVDVATPLTTERYTGNWQGSIEGWLITTKTIQMMMGPGMDKTLPGLQNFYMVGQWVEPGGGLPPAAKSGRDMIKRLCKQDGIPFNPKVA